MYHYVYQITFEEVPHIYFGSRTCKCLPEEDVKYMGSPKRFKSYWKLYTPIKLILVTGFHTKEEAVIYENSLIQKQWDENIDLSLNATIGYEKFHMQGKKRSKESCEKTAAAKAQKYYIVSPSGEVFEGYNFAQFARDKEICRNNCIAVMKGRFLHYKGWTASIAAHKLYTAAYPERGIAYDKRNKNWRVSHNVDKKQVIKIFKNKNDAITYRDDLEESGYVFKINPQGWKQMLADSEVAA